MNRGSNPSTARRKPVAAASAAAHPGAPGVARAELRDGWEQFWFTPETEQSLRIVRTGLGLLAALYFVSHWADIAYWFGAEGVLSTERLGRLNALTEATGVARWRLTPLYWVDSPLGLRLVLGAGILSSLLTALGVGGRWGIALTWALLLSVVSRSWALAGIAEIPLSLGLGGLLIAGGGRGIVSRHREASVRRWTVGLARRLLEVHVAALVAATALAQLAAEAWWNGEGALRLVLPIDGPLWDLTRLGNSPLLAAALTHAIVWLPIVCVPLLWVSAAEGSRVRRTAALLLIIHAIVVGLLSGQLLYEATIAVLLSLFLVRRESRRLEDGE